MKYIRHRCSRGVFWGYGKSSVGSVRYGKCSVGYGTITVGYGKIPVGYGKITVGTLLNFYSTLW